MFKSIRWGTTKYADLHGTFCRPKTVCTTAAHFVARRQIVHGGDEMCRQRRYNLSPATNCAGATKCAVTRYNLPVWCMWLFPVTVSSGIFASRNPKWHPLIPCSVWFISSSFTRSARVVLADEAGSSVFSCWSSCFNEAIFCWFFFQFEYKCFFLSFQFFNFMHYVVTACILFGRLGCSYSPSWPICEIDHSRVVGNAG